MSSLARGFGIKGGQAYWNEPADTEDLPRTWKEAKAAGKAYKKKLAGSSSSGKTNGDATLQGISATTAAAGNITQELLALRNQAKQERMQYEADLRRAVLQGRLAGQETLARGSRIANTQLLENLPSIRRY